jgi:hypothetical protein
MARGCSVAHYKTVERAKIHQGTESSPRDAARVSRSAPVGGASAVDVRSPVAPPGSPAPQMTAPQARDTAVIGPTEGASSDPIILAWQNDLLHAIGRDGQHVLFSLVLIENGEGQIACVALDPGKLEMTSEERTAANAVQEKYGSSPIRAGTRANLWVAPLVHDGVTSDSTASR